MATHYLYGTILTDEAVAANNRGDNVGNTTTLQKVFVHGRLHTSVSAEAIRFALRYRFQLQGLSVNRTYENDTLVYKEENYATWDPDKGGYMDDDLMGFMSAKAAKAEKEADLPDSAGEEAATTGKKGKKGKDRPKGTTDKRTSPLSMGRAISLQPFRGELSFNCVSGTKIKGKLSLYSAEMHTTEYQYSFGLNLGDVVDKRNIGHLVDAIVDPPRVAGNHSRFAYDFSPASIVLRVTSAHSSRIQNCFELGEGDQGITMARLVARVRGGDVPAGELIVGGGVARSGEGQELKRLGASVFDGVRAAADEAMRRIAGFGGAFQGLAS